MMSALPELRFQPTLKRVRAMIGSAPVTDSTRAMLIFEPRRVVPSYAFPEADISATVREVESSAPSKHRSVGFGDDQRNLLDPSIPFAVHTAEGQPVRIETEAGAAGEGFRPADPDLAGYVVLKFDDFDWYEEDEPIVSHPRDPFHRIDVRRSSRHVRIEHEGAVLAETDRAQMLFEGAFPLPRFYMPREDVRVELTRSDLRTECAYKGAATHYNARVGDTELPSIAWVYEQPLSDATQVAGLVSFYQERLDMVLDGQSMPRVRTPWS